MPRDDINATSLLAGNSQTFMLNKMDNITQGHKMN